MKHIIIKRELQKSAFSVEVKDLDKTQIIEEVFDFANRVRGKYSKLLGTTEITSTRFIHRDLDGREIAALDFEPYLGHNNVVIHINEEETSYDILNDLEFEKEVFRITDEMTLPVNGSKYFHGFNTFHFLNGDMALTKKLTL